MSSNTQHTSSEAPSYVVTARGLSKSYTLYKRSSERLLHLLLPWRTYPAFEALKNVSFHVRRGETVGIIGENGAGKSTLLQIVTGTILPTTGEVNISGRVAALLELGAGFEPDFTGRENIYLNGTILGLTRRQLDERMDDIIAFSELEEFIDRPVKTYSSGMFMRLAFSVAAHVDADVLIIDEALSVGDARFTQKCMRFLNDFKQRGSILFVSHDLGAVAGLCDRAIWLEQGKIQAEGDAGRICEQYVESLFRNTPPEITEGGSERHAPVQLGSKVSGAQANYTLSGNPVEIGGGESPPFSKPGITTCSPFSKTANSFGSGGASVIDAGLWDVQTGGRLTQVTDGQQVELRIVVVADEDVKRPIFGFYIKDRLGQNLLGENTVTDRVAVPSIPAGESMAACFYMRWPALMTGTYALTVAIADGVMDDHVQRHWMHDAVMFEVISSAARHGLVGLDISKVTVDRCFQ
ncbi:MAG: ABC transporter ATP-binding protein [Rhodospirillaceae bacterium]